MYLVSFNCSWEATDQSKRKTHVRRYSVKILMDWIECSLDGSSLTCLPILQNLFCVLYWSTSRLSEANPVVFVLIVTPRTGVAARSCYISSGDAKAGPGSTTRSEMKSDFCDMHADFHCCNMRKALIGDGLSWRVLLRTAIHFVNFLIKRSSQTWRLMDPEFVSPYN